MLSWFGGVHARILPAMTRARRPKWVGGQRTDWDDLAQLDPFWAILSDPTRRGGRWDVGEFFGTGRDEIDALMRSASGFGLPAHRRRALDVGCGVGRLTRALAQRFDEVLGVDISQDMIDRANDFASDEPRCRFALIESSPRSALGNTKFDPTHCALVLQHLPSTSVIGQYIEDLVLLLEPGGLLVFQLPEPLPLRRRLQLRPRLYRLIGRLGVSASMRYRLGLHPMRMTGLRHSRVERIVSGAGRQVLGAASPRACRERGSRLVLLRRHRAGARVRVVTHRVDLRSGSAHWCEFSVVTPSYNQGRFIEATLRSVASQTYHDIEHIVIYGGNLLTKRRARVPARHGSRLAYIQGQPDGGQTDALIQGFQPCNRRHPLLVELRRLVRAGHPR